MATQSTSDADSVRAFNEGVRAMQRGDESAAVRHWEEAVSVSASMVPAARNLIVFHEGRGDYGRVGQLYEYILALDPYDTAALIRQATAHRHLERHPEAVRNYRRAIAIYPYYRFWYDELAELLEAIDEPDEAALWRSRADALDSDEAEMAFEDGVRHLRGENFDLAVTIFEAILEDLPANLEARLRLATGLHRVGRSDEALDHLAQALELTDAAPALVHYQRARMLLELGREADAIEDLRFAIDHDSSYGRARNLLQRLTHRYDSGLKLAEPEPAAEPAAVDGVRHTSPHRLSGSHDASIRRTGESRPTDSFDAPTLEAPAEGGPWQQRLAIAIRDATVITSRTGQPGRVALLLDTDPSMIEAAAELINVVLDPFVGLAGGPTPRIYVIEGEAHEGQGQHGVLAEGWLGTSVYPSTDFSRWGVPSMGLPIDRMLEAAGLAVGSDGFNCIVIVGTGAIRGDQTSTLRFVRQLPTYRVVLVSSAGGLGDLGLRLAGIAPNFLELVAN